MRALPDLTAPPPALAPNGRVSMGLAQPCASRQSINTTGVNFRSAPLFATSDTGAPHALRAILLHPTSRLPLHSSSRARSVATSARRKSQGAGLGDLQQLLGPSQASPAGPSSGEGDSAAGTATAGAGRAAGQGPAAANAFVPGVTWDADALVDDDAAGWSVEAVGDEFSDDDEGLDDGSGLVEDVEIFSLESGWSLESLEDILRSAEGGRSSSTGGAAAGVSDNEDEEGRSLHQMAAFSGLPRHMVDALEAASKEAREANAALRPAARKKAAMRRKTHRRLSIIAGTAAGRPLLSPQGDQTRPMMEKVRGAVFSMIQSELGGVSGLPEESRWLDLFAGTGAVGLEALSRGCGQAHFVELDTWVTDKCLKPNMETCSVTSRSVVHTARVEDFLRRGADVPRFAGGAFDFISVCPPYLLVSYEELYDLLDVSPLVKDTTIIIVEYPKQLSHLVRDEVGPLVKIRDRKYGRTILAIYGPASAMDDDLKW